MSDINSVTITGRLSRDPELRTTTGGLSVCKLSMAVNDRVKDGTTGEWGERVNWVDVTVFGNQADSCGKYLEKGRQIAVKGSLRWSSWETDGQKRSKIEVVAEQVQFLGGGGGERRPESDLGEYQEPVPVATADPDDEIPF